MQERPGRGVAPPAAGAPRAGAAAAVPLVGTDPTTVSDAHLAAAWAARDPLAPGEVYRRYGALLFGAAACLLDDRTVAADAVHDAFARAGARVWLLEAPARLPVWLLAVVRAEAAQRSLHPPGAAWSPAPALPAAQWRAAGPPVADALWSAAAALGDRDREVLELTARGVGDVRDLADVLGVAASQAAVLAADLRVRLEASLGALLVARAGGEGCPELGAALAARGPAWTADVLVLVVRHQQDCMDCRAVRSRLMPAVPPIVEGARHVPADPALRARVMATLGVDAAAAVLASGVADVEESATTSWLVDVAPAGLSGRGWTWYPDGFPAQPPQAVRRVPDVVAEAGALAAAEAAAFAAAAARSARPKRRVPLAAAALVGAPLLVGALVLGGVLRTGAGLPGGADPGRAPGVVVADGAGAAAPSGPVPATPDPDASRQAGGTARGSGTAGGIAGGTEGGTVTPTAEGTPAGAASGAPASAAQDPRVPVGGPDGTVPGPGETTAAGSPTRMPASASAADGASVSPDTVRVPGGSDCTPLKATVTVPAADPDAVAGSVTWSNGRTTKTTPLVAGDGALTAKVGPFHVAGPVTLTITVSTATASDTVTRTLDVAPCGDDD